MSKRHVLWFIGMALLVAICIRPVGAKRGEMFSEYRAFVGITNKIVENYVDKVDRKKLFEGACRGMMNTLDPYSQFISPEMLREFNDNTQGEFGGLGIEIDMRGGILTVITPIKGGPAYDAGVMAGDMIVEIDGESTEGMTIHDAVMKLRGPVGAKVTITVVHEENRKTEKIAITRQLIQIPAIEHEMVDKENKFGYVYIKSFVKDTGPKAEEAIKGLQKQGMKGLILDLRNDPGGLFPSAIEVADLFLNKGAIVRTRGRDQELVKEAKATSNFLGDFPLVVLINKGSASASEIVAGAIKDNMRGILVGTKSYGKATVQSLITVDLGEEDGKPVEGALKLTTARYYTPNDISIDKKGIEPDIKVDMTVEQQIALLRQQRREFLMKQRRDKNPEESKQEPAKESPDAKKNGDDEADNGNGTSLEKEVKNILNNFDRGRLSVREAVQKIMSALSGENVALEATAPAEEAVDIQLQRGIEVLKVYDLVREQLKANASAK